MDKAVYYIYLVLIAAASVFLNSCARATDPLIERGVEFHFKPGYPEMRLAAFGYLDENEDGLIMLTADVASHSLIFKMRDGKQVAEILAEFRIDGIEGTQFSDTITETKEFISENDITLMHPEYLHIRRNINVSPGNYRITLSIVDETSGRRISRSSDVYIPDPESGEISLSAVQLLGIHPDREWEGYMPVISYHVKSVKDSLRFNIQVSNMQLNLPVTVQSQLIRFTSDTTAANPMNHPNYTVSSLPYKGIDYRDQKVIDQRIRVFEEPGTVMIEFRKERPDRGNYRFEVRVEGPGIHDDLYRARDFSVKSEHFPYIRNVRELAEPLIYLMGEREHRRLMAIEDPAELKDAIDRFWLSNVGSISRARQVISLYYDRVEQANKQFTNFKAGWKTDTGMIYILFGPPWYVTTRLNQMQWSYAYNWEDPSYNYVFERSRAPSEFFPFNNYLLQRNPDYFTIQYQQIQRWKTGLII